MKKYLVFIERNNPRSQPASWEFNTSEDVAKFLATEDRHRVSVFVQVENLDFTKGHPGLTEQLFGAACDTDLFL
jgi:hypothetical protein